MCNKRFDYYWKVSLIVILSVAMIFMFWQFSQVDKDGVACKSQPFIYGARQMTERPNVDHVSCSCSIVGEDYFKPYSFNENQENPF